MVPEAIGIFMHAECWTGRFPYTTPDALEGVRLARETGQRNCDSHLLAMLAMAAAIRGDDEECERNARDALAIARPHGVGLVVALATWALALLDLVHGRSAAAFARLRQLRLAGPGIGHPIVALYATPYFVEAAVGVGAVDEARTALTAYACWARAVNQDGPLALAARGEALLAAGAGVEEHFRESLEHHLGCNRDFERGYTELLYATHLRRNRRRAEARKYLRSALEVFERLELDLWIKRVRAEQRATGERVGTGTPRTDGGGPAQSLTPHQLQIVQHIAEGATNREVAQRLFVSPRTVDYHLRNIFTKLGIRSRSELIRRFG
jgi:DNA-binding CsgD family transcriptional regulator